MSKIGKRDLFSPTGEPSPANPRRLTSAENEVEKVMVMLSPRQVHALDKICLEIRQTTGVKVKRSLLIRSVIDGFLGTRIRYDDARSTGDVHEIIARSIQVPPSPSSFRRAEK
jgi:hypothetical protein